MSKMKYIQPQMAIEPVSTDAFVMLLDSFHPVPTPARHDVAPPVPGETI